MLEAPESLSESGHSVGDPGKTCMEAPESLSGADSPKLFLALLMDFRTFPFVPS